MKSTKDNLVDKYLPSTHIVDLYLPVYHVCKTLLYSRVLMSRLLGSFHPIAVICGGKLSYLLDIKYNNKLIIMNILGVFHEQI